MKSQPYLIYSIDSFCTNMNRPLTNVGFDIELWRKSSFPPPFGINPEIRSAGSTLTHGVTGMLFFVRQRLYADDTVWWQIASRSPTIKRMIFDSSQTPENYQNYYSLLLPLCHTNQFYLGGQDSWRIRIIKKRLRLCRVKGIKSTSSQNIFMFRCRRHRKKKM